nr:unnamed protein product [Spirometra erinaceieuropaei]
MVPLEELDQGILNDFLPDFTKNGVLFPSSSSSSSSSSPLSTTSSSAAVASAMLIDITHNPETSTDVNTTTTTVNTTDKDPVYTCPNYDRISTARIGLIGHLRIHRRETGGPVSGALTCNRRTRLHSPHCNRTLIHRMGLSGHMRVHADLK